MRSMHQVTGVAAIAITLILNGASAQSWIEVTEEAKLLPVDTSHTVRMGESVAIHGNMIAAGSLQNSGWDDGGIVYVFDGSSGSWTLTAELDPVEVLDGDEFGHALDFDDSGRLMIGSPLFGPAGSTYSMGNGFVYETDWLTYQEIGPTYATQGDRYGTSVGMDGNRIAIGSPNEHYDGSLNGAVSIFEHNGFIWLDSVSLLTPSDPSDTLQFGKSLGLSGDWLAVGDPGISTSLGKGRAYLFQEQADGSWSEMQQLEDPNGAANGSSLFGERIILADDLLLISAPSGTQNEYVYIYELQGGTWNHVDSLSSPDGETATQFGIGIATDTDRIVVGASNADFTASNDGVAWVFEVQKGMWIATHRLSSSNPTSGDFLGYSVGIDGDTVVAGAYNDDDVATNSGAAYVFLPGIADCNGNGIDDADDLADGTSADCNGNSIPDECEDDCNGNGIADECDLSDGTSSDCNGNGVPDECDDDCNGNGTPDDCDMEDEPRRDWDGNGVLDECEGIACWNTTQYTSHALIADALAGIDGPGQVIGVFQYALDAEPEIDFEDSGHGVVFTAWESLVFPSGGTVMLGDHALVSRTDGEDQSLYFLGHVEVPLGAYAQLLSTDIGFQPAGSVTVRPGAILQMADVDNHFHGDVSLLGGTISHSGYPGYLDFGGTFSGFGILDTDEVLQSGMMNIQADLEIIGALYNYSSGTINVQNGVLTVLGGVTNEGTITGDVSGRGSSRDSDGMTVFGDLVCSASSSMNMAVGQRLGVEGNIDIAANDPVLFDLSGTDLRCIGLGDTQSVEMLSRDRGASLDGFEAAVDGNMPLSSLRIGPAAASVMLVDNHDNDVASSKPEAIYVNTLIMDAGTYLETSGLKIYCLEALIDPTAVISNEEDVVIIDDSCEGDVDGNYTVDVIDLLNVISNWGSCVDPNDCSSDIDSNGVVNVLDLLAVISAWGECGS